MAKMMEKNKCVTYHKYMGIELLILGILIILNSMYVWFSWGVFVGGIIGIKGLIMLLMPK